MWAELARPLLSDPMRPPKQVLADVNTWSLDRRLSANQNGRWLVCPIKVQQPTASTVAMQISLPRESRPDDPSHPCHCTRGQTRALTPPNHHPNTVQKCPQESGEIARSDTSPPGTGGAQLREGGQMPCGAGALSHSSPSTETEKSHHF